MVKKLPLKQELQETQVLSLGLEDPLEEGQGRPAGQLRARGAWQAIAHGVAELNKTEQLTLTHKVLLKTPDIKA